MRRPPSVLLAAVVMTLAVAGVIGSPALGDDGNPDTKTVPRGEDVLDENAAIKRSQAAIGHTIDDLSFRDSAGKTVRLSDYRGRPLVLNFIYTSCAHSCSVLTSQLEDAYDNARDVFGEDAFTAVTIGFETAEDTPKRMRAYATKLGVHNTPGWHFLSGDADTVNTLVKTTGFTYYPTAKGFDHLDQVTLIDKNGVIHTQVYGATFDKPLLIEPMKELVFGTPTPYRSLSELIKKVRLFCTLYDPAADRYKFDYSIFIQLSAGIIIIGSVIIILLRELWGRRHFKNRSV